MSLLPYILLVKRMVLCVVCARLRACCVRVVVMIVTMLALVLLRFVVVRWSLSSCLALVLVLVYFVVF